MRFTIGDSPADRLHLETNTCKTLGQCVMDLMCHAFAFFENCLKLPAFDAVEDTQCQEGKHQRSQHCGDIDDMQCRPPGWRSNAPHIVWRSKEQFVSNCACTRKSVIPRTFYIQHANAGNSYCAALL